MLLTKLKLFGVFLSGCISAGILQYSVLFYNMAHNAVPLQLQPNPINNTEIKPEKEVKITKTGTIERLTFNNINNRVFLLESFRDIQTGDLYVLTVAEEHKETEILQINCVLCKNEYSLYDDLDECTALEVKAVHKREWFYASSVGTTFFHCIIPPQLNAKNYSLSTLKIDKEYGHLVKISNINKEKIAPNNTLITMCAGPQFGKSKKAINLAEWIEFHRLMGVNKFQIYVTDKDNVSKEYHKMLKKYTEEGVVDLIYWENLNRSHYYTQFTLINHCVWRNKAKSNLVVYNDIDEFFVPANNSYNNWNKIFDTYLTNANNSEIRFRNWYYDASCPNNQDKSGLMLSSVFIRKNEPLTDYDKTKWILRPERILLAGVHWTDEFMPEHEENNYQAIVMPSEIGYMAHFRGEVVNIPNCDLTKAKDVEVNENLTKYGKMIAEKVNKMKELIEENKVNTTLLPATMSM